jgi:hypothetical protein
LRGLIDWNSNLVVDVVLGGFDVLDVGLIEFRESDFGCNDAGGGLADSHD